MATNHLPREGDLPLTELASQVAPLIEEGHAIFLKWTCPACGERVTSSDPLSIVTHPVTHLPCVALHALYKHSEKDDGTACDCIIPAAGSRFGYTVVTGDIDWLLDALKTN